MSKPHGKHVPYPSLENYSISSRSVDECWLLKKNYVYEAFPGG
jgi:hypothetical protein